jgi:IS5 family transposase
MEGILALFIPIMALSIPFFAIWIKHREKMLDKQVGATAEHTAERAAHYASHVRELEERVRVLERIVTDGGYDVATQIEALRDQRRVEDKNETRRDPAVL